MTFLVACLRLCGSAAVALCRAEYPPRTLRGHLLQWVVALAGAGAIVASQLWLYGVLP